jgi:hypothetical protein
MPSVGLGVSSKGPLKEALGALPEDFKPFILLGFASLAKLDGAAWRQVISLAQTSSPAAAQLELSSAADELKLDTSQVSKIVVAARLLLGVISFRDESPADFAAVATEVGILRPEDAPKILEFGNLAVGSGQDIKRQIEASELQNSLLPSLRRFETRIDVRLDFSDGKPTAAAPVALVYVESDAPDGNFWFQMTPTQTRLLAKKLGDASRELAAAEELVQRFGVK